MEFALNRFGRQSGSVMYWGWWSAYKGLAREIRAPILVITDLSRTLEARLDKRPTLGDLSDLGDIDKHADLVLFLYRDAMYNSEFSETEIAEVIVAKQRDGAPTGTVRLGFRKKIGKFENIAPGL